MQRRVVVTGLGVVSACGLNVNAFWDSMRQGRSGIHPITTLPPNQLRFTNACDIPDFDPNNYFDPKEAAYLDRFAHYGAVAAREAIKDSGVEFSGELKERTAIVTGSCLGGKASEDEGYVQLYRCNTTRCNPLTIPKAMANGAASRISFEHGLVGPTYTISTACSSANHAIGQAFWMVRNGGADLAVTGGSEAVFSLGLLYAWNAMRVVSPDTCRPFSKDRKGLVLGDGAGILILEPLETARARGARIYAEIVGFGMSSDAHHITQPSSEGAARALRGALEDAGMAPEEVSYINAHGTGTDANDRTETAAIRSVFGPHADKLAVSSTKSMHGHTLGAAGAIEAVATILAMRCGTIPPTANYTTPDPACDLDVVPNTPRQLQVGAAVSNSFAFGGLNAVLAFRAHER
ncbi:MAG: beta-ketoacyl-[acyl-carrier-protein] synthase family protein [Acidobacteria bacterium]|nr:beta-ketoacyl-[acyl-carrier-protein] synthase family protein [Acidobacteriota bacterium]